MGFTNSSRTQVTNEYSQYYNSVYAVNPDFLTSLEHSMMLQYPTGRPDRWLKLQRWTASLANLDYGIADVIGVVAGALFTSCNFSVTPDGKIGVADYFYQIIYLPNDSNYLMIVLIKNGGDDLDKRVFELQVTPEEFASYGYFDYIPAHVPRYGYDLCKRAFCDHYI